MLPRQQVSFFVIVKYGLFLGLLISSLVSCVVVSKKQYQKYKPFVFKTNITVAGNIPASQKQELNARLQNQLDDSLKTRVISYAGLVKKLVKPPVFDTVNIATSKIFMTALLNSEGYFYPSIKDSFTIDTISDAQKRVTVNFQVTPGKRTRMDSIGFDLLTPELQELALENRDKTLLKKNTPYTLSKVSDEIDRVLQVFHNNGYYKVSRDDVYAEVDTVVAALIDPSLDPFEQLRLLDSLRRKSENPTINVVIKQREAADTTRLKQFYIGQVSVFPDQQFLQDTLGSHPMMRSTVPGYKFRFFTNTNKFKLPFIARNVFLIPDSLYRERNYFRTVNTFNRLGAWQNVDVTLRERYDSLAFLDTDIRLYPSLRQNLKIDFEASRNIADYLTTSQLFGLGLNFSLTNRNAFREAIQTSTNARFGIELGSNFIQTLQTNLSHSIYFPRLMLPFGIKPHNEDSLLSQRTVININGAYTIRRSIFNVGSINGSLSYEWARSPRERVQFNWQVVPLNIEFTRLEGKDSLSKLIQQIPSLRYAFNDGFVIGMIGAMNSSWAKGNRLSNLKIRVEESGAIFGFIKQLEDNNLFRFVKTDIEFKNIINFKQSALAFRAFAGYGYVYGKRDGQAENKLPFFKAYFAGGPYSMRAWQVRRLGPGSSLLYDTVSNVANDRFGNMQLEGNVEYRFNLTTIAGIKVRSALFIDAGNIWGPEFRDAAATQKIPDASFKFSRLYKDIAVGAGTSLRFDFDFFLIRLDWAYKIKNPTFSDKNNGGWFYGLGLFNGQFQLGIGYPF